jgi:hypothetical protein
MAWHRALLICCLMTISPLYAQRGFQNYPYCAQYSDGSSQVDCSFTTLSMCYQSVTGVGGTCINNPRAGGSAPTRNSEFAFGPAPVPPPPSQSQNLLQLPGTAPQEQAQPAVSAAGAQTATRPCNPVVDGTYCATAASNSTTPIQSLASDLSVGSDPPGAIDLAGADDQPGAGDFTSGGYQPATLGAINFGGSGVNCIGLFRQRSC